MARAALLPRAWFAALVLVATVAAAPFSARAAEPKFPTLTGRVVDEAGILSPAAEAHLTEWLGEYEAQTKRQVVVATVSSLQGLPIEDYGYRLGRFWGIGQKDSNTGAILIVAPNGPPGQRDVRIEVGYGLEGELTDAVSRVIIENIILPQFKQGNYEEGIFAGTAAILKTLGWQGRVEAPASSVRKDRGDRQPEASIGGFVWLFVLLFFIYLGGSYLNRRGGGTWTSGPGGGGGGGRGGFGGGGGFSGRGGSFGGGGASGRW